LLIQLDSIQVIKYWVFFILLIGNFFF
jgi:hypothetical protein